MQLQELIMVLIILSKLFQLILAPNLRRLLIKLALHSKFLIIKHTSTDNIFRKPVTP